LVLEQHLRIEDAFGAVKAATDLSSRRTAQKWLAVILTGHANAEESVLYPALARVNEKGHAGMGYSEQAAAKMQMAALESLNPMSPAYLDKLEHVRCAVAHHMCQEEGTWFLELKNKTPPADAAKLTQRFCEEFDRYVGKDKTMAA
jgi:phage terminase small subunit